MPWSEGKEAKVMCQPKLILLALQICLADEK